MRAHGIVGVHRRRRGGCTRSDPEAIPSSDLVERRFRAEGPDQLWCCDITQHRTGEGWLYCAVVLDVYSRRVVGWSIADHLRSEMSSTRWTWPVGDANPQVSRPWSTPTTAVSTPLGRSGNACEPPGCWARWARSAIASITPWPRASSPACRSNCSTARLDHSSAARQRDLRVDRGLVQPPTPPLGAGLPQPGRLREPSTRRGYRGLTPNRTRPRKRGKVRYCDR